MRIQYLGLVVGHNPLIISVFWCISVRWPWSTSSCSGELELVMSTPLSRCFNRHLAGTSRSFWCTTFGHRWRMRTAISIFHDKCRTALFSVLFSSLAAFNRGLGIPGDRGC